MYFAQVPLQVTFTRSYILIKIVCNMYTLFIRENNTMSLLSYVYDTYVDALIRYVI